ncbi:uncharacterized protein LOC142349628 [Convolutriloba macropyga]|uniref:uncharacterized protein LOC142349628 n=1 Tax=Convolutriloba macropyga TaxID=536237 RepID=UPI003F5203D1
MKHKMDANSELWVKILLFYLLLTFVKITADQEQNATEDTPSQTSKEQLNYSITPYQEVDREETETTEMVSTSVIPGTQQGTVSFPIEPSMTSYADPITSNSTVTSQPAETTTLSVTIFKKEAKENNNSSTVLYAFLIPVLSVCFIAALFFIIYESRRHCFEKLQNRNSIERRRLGSSFAADSNNFEMSVSDSSNQLVPAAQNY